MVKCHGCVECCRGFDPVYLLPNESGYAERVHDGRRALQHKFNGDCVYLGDKGCTIHESKPFACRLYDCRDAVPKAIPFGNVRAKLIEAMERARAR